LGDLVINGRKVPSIKILKHVECHKSRGYNLKIINELKLEG